MATSAADVKRDYGVQVPNFPGELDVIASDIIYEGSAVGESSSGGTFRPLAGGDVFAGFAARRADNSAGGASAITVKVNRQGTVELTVASTTPGLDDIGEDVYASDDATFTTASTGNTKVGKIVSWTGVSTKFTVFFQAAAFQSI